MAFQYQEQGKIFLEEVTRHQIKMMDLDVVKYDEQARNSYDDAVKSMLDPEQFILLLNDFNSTFLKDPKLVLFQKNRLTRQPKAIPQIEEEITKLTHFSEWWNEAIDRPETRTRVLKNAVTYYVCTNNKGPFSLAALEQYKTRIPGENNPYQMMKHSIQLSILLDYCESRIPAADQS